MTDSFKILGIPVTSLDLKGITDHIDRLLDSSENGRTRQLVTLNPLIFESSLKLKKLYKIIVGSFLVIPESIGLKIIGWFHFRSFNRVRGIELMESLLELADSKKKSVYLVGSRKDVISKAVGKINERYPGVVVLGSSDGYFNEAESEDIVRSISLLKPDMLFVGMQTPRQEVWIGENLDRFSARVAMGVGGSLDCIAGELKVAPVWMRLSGFEWLFRTWQEPWRLARLVRIPVFLVKVFLHRLKIIDLIK